MIERWIGIEDHPEYQVSEWGRIWSCGTVRTMLGRWGMMTRATKPKELKPYRMGQYLGVRFTMGGKNYYIHRLVAQHFIREIDAGLEVNHKNGNKHDNRLENLEVVTPRENRLHSTHVLGHRAGQFGPGRTRIGKHA